MKCEDLFMYCIWIGPQCKKWQIKFSAVEHTCNPSSLEGEGSELQVQTRSGQFGDVQSLVLHQQKNKQTKNSTKADKIRNGNFE